MSLEEKDIGEWSRLPDVVHPASVNREDKINASFETCSKKGVHSGY